MHRTELFSHLRPTLDFILFSAGQAGAGLPLLAAALGLAALAAGIWQMRLRWWLAAGGLLLIAVLWAALASEPEAEAVGDERPRTLEVLTLHVRPTDSITGQPVSDAEIAIVRHQRPPAGDHHQAASDDALAQLSVAAHASDGETIVSALVDTAPRGTVWAQLRRPRVDLAGFEFTVEASGYQTWRVALDDLLPDRWPIEPASLDAIEVRLVARGRSPPSHFRPDPSLPRSRR